MRIIQSSFEVLYPVSASDIAAITDRIEIAARTCYKSAAKNNQEAFLRKIVSSGHESVIEHGTISVKMVCDRGVSHELVRHRLFSFSQESTRYCNYAKDSFGKQLTFIIPDVIDAGTIEQKATWTTAMLISERMYFNMLAQGFPPEIARGVLPHDLATTIVVTGNLREWRHFLKLRSLGVSGKPHPAIKKLADGILQDFIKKFPVFFEDLLTVN